MFKTGKKKGQEKQTPEQRAENIRVANRRLEQAKVRAGQEIGPIPEVKDWKRREACFADPELFLRTYFGERPYFYTPFCSDHRKVIAKFEDAIRNGGLFTLAMPRSHGKTTFARAFTIRAIATGMRHFAFFIGAAMPHARRSLEAIKSMMIGSTMYDPDRKIFVNPSKFAQDFPEIVFPAAALGRTPNRQKGQMCCGTPTDIHWSGDYMQLPTIKPCETMRPEQHRCGGAIAMGAGLLGSAITGLNINGMRPDLVIPDDPQTREALDIETPIPTPSGFVKMGELRVGDTVFDEEGKTCKVIGASPIEVGRECFEVVFDDESRIVADAGHLWNTSTSLQRTNARRKVKEPRETHCYLPQCQAKPFVSTRTTKEIADTVCSKDGPRSNHSIPMAGQLVISEKALPIPPYTLGAWLGDGASACARITSADFEIIENIKKDGFLVGDGKGKRGVPNKALDYRIGGLQTKLRLAGILHNKHVPSDYLFASPDQRLSLLQGLMDTDGWISLGYKGIKGVRCNFSNTNKNLVESVLVLCRSLGIKARCVSGKLKNERAAPWWVVTFITNIPVFRLARKLARLPSATMPHTKSRYIVAVNAVQTRPVRCISVDSPSKLFLCGDALITTHNSAQKDAACQKREEIINAMVTGLAGAGVRLAAVMPVTVIREGDLADRFLSHALHPEWAIERTQLLHAMPTNMELWRANKDIRGNYNPYAGPEDKHRAAEAATLHYIDNQAAMDAGSEASWPERINDDEVSAIQNAMNMHNDNRRAFFAEMQNQPLPPDMGNTKQLTADDIAAKLSQVAHREVPFDASTLTAFIDVQKNMLYYCVCAFVDGFTGYVIDYGTFPDQRREYFTAAEAPMPLDRMPGAPEGEEPRLVWALEVLVEALMNREWLREKTAAPNKIDLCLVDSGNWSQLVYQFCRRTKYKVVASKGMPYHAGSKASTGEGKVHPGDKRGYHWHLPAAKEERGVKLLVYDANPWKSFFKARLATPSGAAGCLSLFGSDPSVHRMFVDHLLSEYCDRNTNERTQRTVEEWHMKPGRPDNHWLDCLSGACVAAAVSGVTLEGAHQPAKQRRNAPRLSIDEIKKRRETEQQKAGVRR